jgi:hypothetical protein
VKLIEIFHYKLNVLRNLHNYMGYFNVSDRQGNRIEGNMTIGEQFPFTAIFIRPDEIELAIKYQDHTEIRHLKKLKEIKPGFQYLK